MLLSRFVSRRETPGKRAVSTLRSVLSPLIGITTCTHDAGGPVESVHRVYVDAVVAAGGTPVVLPILAPADAPGMLDRLDGLLLSGGADVEPAAYGADAHPAVYGVDPARDAWELALARAATVPVLGICRGSQVLNVAAGGTLVQHLADVTAETHRDADRSGELVHDVRVVPGSRLHAVVGGLGVGVNTLHHQAVDSVGAGLVVSATAPDGTIEAVEGAGERLVLGVQWHPELLPGHEEHASLFAWLVSAAGARRAHGAIRRPALN